MVPDDDRSSPPSWGTIFSGGRELTLGGIEHVRSTAWTPADEDAYLQRIREKASRMAADILAEAGRQADTVRESARREGYARGMAEAQAELESLQSHMADSVAAVLSSIEGRSAEIFDQWREDLTAVARLAVEKITALELSRQSAAILEALLVQAVGLLENRRCLVVRVNPEDEPVISDIVSFTRDKFPDIASWRVRADASVSPGGLVVESESSLAEGRLESRRAAVEEVFDRLTLPGTP
ncbi:MAG: flagellar assembly protein FliH [Desulfovibrio sp.]|jgi:flagellar assembly protein FliH|nr:flagellar assembly protein FliH [Desulfovibrio sp.]